MLKPKAEVICSVRGGASETVPTTGSSSCAIIGKNSGQSLRRLGFEASIINSRNRKTICQKFGVEKYLSEIWSVGNMDRQTQV